MTNLKKNFDSHSDYLYVKIKEDLGIDKSIFHLKLYCINKVN